MKFKPVLMALVATTIGLVTAVSVGRKPGDASAEPEVAATQAILVAAFDMDAGIPMSSNNIHLEFRAKKDVPAGSYHSLAQLQSRFSLRRLKAGQPITTQNTTTSEEVALDSVPSGYRMCVIHTSMAPSLQTALKPGARVDVLAYLPQSRTVPAPVTRRVARAARVHRYQMQGSAGDQDPLVPCVVSLLVKQDEVQSLLLAAENGLLRLAMIGDATGSDDRQDDYTYQQLVASLPIHGNPPLVIHDRGRQRPAPVPVPEERTGPTAVSKEDTAAMIEEAVAKAVAAAIIKAEEESPTQTTEAEVKAKRMHWTMDVFTPSGVTQYRWKTADSRPIVMVADDQAETIAGLQTNWEKIETALQDDEQGPPRK